MGIEDHPAVKFYLERYLTEFIAEDALWARFYIDECGRIRVLFEDDYQKLFKPDAYFMNITDRPEQLKSFKIEEVRISKVERNKVECDRKYQAVFIATNGIEWARFYVDEHGRIWARFTNTYEDLYNVDIEAENITDYPEALQRFKIKEVEVYEERIVK
jgi:hypothetical protein